VRKGRRKNFFSARGARVIARRRRDAELGDLMRRDVSGWDVRLDAATIATYTEQGVWLDRTIADRLDQFCTTRPDQLLVVDDGRMYSVTRTCDDARRLARAMMARGLRPGQVVSFQLPNWYEAVVVELACAYGGFVCNPIVPIYRDAEVAHILADSGSRLFVVAETFRGYDYAAMVARLRPGLPRLSEVVYARPEVDPSRLSFDQFLEEGRAETLQRPDPNSVKLILYTSGTTNRAKGVLHTHNTIDTEIRNVIDWLRLTASDVVLMPSTLGHITGYLYGIQLPVTLGCPVVLMDTWSVEHAADLIDRHGVTFTLGATPFLQELARFARSQGRPLPTLRYFPTGGAPVPPEVIYEANRAFSRCTSFRLYGSTEAPTVTLGVPDRTREDLGATTEGYVVGHEIRLVDPEGRTVSPGSEGEIVTRGPEMCVGYAAAEHNAEAFDAEGYFHTGDLARQTPEGCLVITGRKKDLIIRGGENISPKEVEDVLYQHPAIREVAVVAMPHARLGETGCAFVTLRPGQRFDFEAMVHLLEQSGLAKQKFPERLEIVDTLPYTAAGKIRKNLLRDEIAARIEAEHGRGRTQNRTA
jgi:acyl-CoA synthetase (AMP-forming)/AMP-acid ligase II